MAPTEESAGWAHGTVGYAGFIVDTAFASEAHELAGLAALHNAWLLVGLPVALLGQAVSQSAFPRLAGHAAAGNWPAMRRTLLWALATPRSDEGRALLAQAAAEGLLVTGV